MKSSQNCDGISGPVPGQIALVKSGRCAGQYVIIIKLVDGQFVLIADGEALKNFRPKKKNIRHLQLVDRIVPEVYNSIMETGCVTNGKLRFALTRFLNERLTDEEKGDEFDG
ncbi:KOW domain-containing RNA-binding protein [Bacillus sp. FJAT-27445]|uniref:KOW domain-containing RNA-binding protein n=1 Tax=Bacillus sp. FJAT-27445 TaxID=1679166 RepID=UPI0020A5FD37|nr:KOW domain-containing RNA-binding protein [Bacillus sp. FJAT-27445]